MRDGYLSMFVFATRALTPIVEVPVSALATLGLVAGGQWQPGWCVGRQQTQMCKCSSSITCAAGGDDLYATVFQFRGLARHPRLPRAAAEAGDLYHPEGATGG